MTGRLVLRTGTIATLLAAGALAAGAPGGAGAKQTGLRKAARLDRAAVNKARKSNGVPRVRDSSPADQVALQLAKHDVSTRGFTHLPYAEFLHRLRTAGACVRAAALNQDILGGYSASDPVGLVAANQQSYRGSPSHWAQLLDPRWRRIGDAFAQGPGFIFNVEVFVQPCKKKK